MPDSDNNIRMQFGEASMDVMDALDDDLTEALGDLADIASVIAEHFSKHGISKPIATGLVIGIVIDPFVR